MPLTYHPEAEADLAQAAVFYEDRSPGLGDRFLDEFERAIRAIQTSPERWPVIQDDLRCFSLDHFPYSIYYRLIDDSVRILVIRHHKRHPDYGRDRS